MLVGQQQRLQDDIREIVAQFGQDRSALIPVLQELQNSPLFDPDPAETRTDSEVTYDETGTFTFRIIARLKYPLKL